MACLEATFAFAPTTAMLSALFTSLSSGICGDHNTSSSKMPLSLYNRPKFLLAPEASALAEPRRFFMTGTKLEDEKHDALVYIDTSVSGTTIASPVSLRPIAAPRGVRQVVARRSAVSPSVLAQAQLVSGFWSRGSPPSVHSDTQPQLSFPAPPSLDDIKRMEPQWPLQCALRMAAEIGTATERVVVEDSPLPPNEGSRDGGCPTVSASFFLGSPDSLDFDNELFDPAVLAIERPVDTSKEPQLRKAHPTPVTLTATLSDDTGYALSVWLADYLYDVVLNARASSLPSGSSLPSEPTRSRAATMICHVLGYAPCPRHTFLLALWYIGRLPVGLFVHYDDTHLQFRNALYGHGSHSTEDIIVRAFVVGLMLADKWINEGSPTSRTWSKISGLPLYLINTLESSALASLEYSIGIGGREYEAWFEYLRAYHASLARFEPVGRRPRRPYVVIRDLLDDCISAVHPGDTLDTISFKLFRDDSLSMTSSLNTQPCAALSQRSSSSSYHLHSSSPVTDPPFVALSFPALPPVEWCPEADEIVSKPMRTICTAPGADRMNNSFPSLQPTVFSDATELSAHSFLGTGVAFRATYRAMQS